MNVILATNVEEKANISDFYHTLQTWYQGTLFLENYFQMGSLRDIVLYYSIKKYYSHHDQIIPIYVMNCSSNIHNKKMNSEI